MTKHHENETENGKMASNFDEVVELGQEMEAQRTNKELKEQGHTPDPKQHDNN